jgi:hypothetical protein
MKSFFTNCDFIGYSPNLYVEGNKNYRTAFTGFISLIIIIISIMSFGYFSSELLVHSTPIIIESRETFGEVGPLNYSNKDLLFMFAMEYSNSTLYSDPTIFTVEAILIKTETLQDPEGRTNQKITTKNIKMELCSKYYNDNDILEQNLKLPLNKYYCAEPNESYMQGYWGANNATKIKVYFNKCENSTANNFSCRPQEEIEKIVQGGYISIKYTTFLVDQKDYFQPLKRVFYDDFNMLNSESSLEYAIQFKYMNFNSDNGLMFQNLNIYNGLYSFTRVFTRFSKSKTIFLATFEGSSVGLSYLRSYTKLQTVVTQIGGFIKAITMIASLISFLFSKNLLFSNNLFKILTYAESDSRLNFETTFQRPPMRIYLKQSTLAKRQIVQLNQTINLNLNKIRDDKLFETPPLVESTISLNFNKSNNMNVSRNTVNRNFISQEINKQNQFVDIQPVLFIFLNYFT